MKPSCRICWILLAMTVSVPCVAADAGPDGGDTDTGETEFCDSVSDPCCLDNGSDAEVLALSGCHGEPHGPADVGMLGGECTYDPDDPAGLGNCNGIEQCWNYHKWFDTGVPAVGGECGLCLQLCTNFSSCPDGETSGFSYDFCTSTCPDGMRCWVYKFEDNLRGLCMADCVDDDDCSSGICAPEWNVCVPRDEDCPLSEDTDSWPDTSTWPEGDGGFPDSGGESGPDEGGCVCSPTPPRGVSSLFGALFAALTR